LKNGPKTKTPHSLTINGVLDALEHFASHGSEKGVDDSSSVNFYLTVFLYINTILQVKKKV
jgi:hypothetical protein